MLTSLSDFDPISFLSINTANLSEQDSKQLKDGLNAKIGEYVLLKFSQDLPEVEFERITAITNGQEVLTELKKSIPNMDERMIEEMENFKREYQAVHRGGIHA